METLFEARIFLTFQKSCLEIGPVPILLVSILLLKIAIFLSTFLSRLMQAIPGVIKTPVILTSNEMPDENTDQNTTQPPYRLTTYFNVISSLNPEQGKHDEFATGFKVASNYCIAR